MRVGWWIWIGLMYVAGIPLSGQYSGQRTPCSFPEKQGLYFDLLQFHVEYYNSAFAPGDVLLEEQGRTRVSFRPVADRIDPVNTAGIEAKVTTLQLGYVRNNLKFEAGHRYRYHTGNAYSADMIRLITFGNAPFVGTTINIGPSSEFLSYQEIFLGLTGKTGPLTLGGKFKLLAGNEHLFSFRDQIRLLTTESDYSLLFDNSYEIRGSGIFAYNGLNDVSFDLDAFGHPVFFGENPGWAMDLSIRYDLSSSTFIALDMEDLGSIRWTRDAKSFLSSGAIVYEGINLLDYLSDDQEVSISDSLYNLLEFVETPLENYKRAIPMQWTISFGSKWSEKSNMLASAGLKQFGDERVFVGDVVLRYLILNWMETGVRYRIIGKTYDNLGLHAALLLGRVKWRVDVYNVPGLFGLSGRYGGLGMGISYNY